MTKRIEKGMVFGVFDGLHEGHRHFLAEAKSRCKKLVVVVAPDETVVLLKRHSPKYPFSERVEAIQKFDQDFEVISGDIALNTWDVVRTHRPDLVFLGYDQKPLASSLAKLNIPFQFLEAHEPERYHSSLLHKTVD